MNETCEHIAEQTIPQEDTRPKRMTSALILLSFCVAFLMTGFGIIVPVYPQRLQALGLGAETLALMEAGFGLGMFLFSTPMGTLADRIGRRPIVLLSLSGFIVTNIALAFVNVPALFILIRFVEGALVAGLFPVASAIVGDSVTPEQQGRWLGILTTAQAAGTALGPGVGGLLYQAWGFSVPFLFSAGLALVASLLALFMLPETLPAHVREKARLRKTEKQSGAKSARGDMLGLIWLFAGLFVIDFGMAFTYPFALPQYPFFFEQTLHYTAAEYGAIISVFGLAMGFFPMLLGGLSARLPRKLLIIVGIVLSAAMNVGMLFLHQYPLLIASAVLTGAGVALIMPALGTVYLSETNDENRSQAMGLRGSVISLAILIAPLSQAAVAHWITPQITFAISLAIALVVTVTACFVLKNQKASAPQASQV
ncbi:MFS transporter [Ktedonosporobacter rubrisoli]|uniref:MFS transporter n=1 Tax=Ktedonosporobacter rubrisoli TaxID=2509675 RepID=A0A4P6JYG7_KTERU|nr:MFS transporter [Ktedonosporobacter rubrisoli]QBD80839.1 MFS transporter [Ktedonosporobacter rubrisoli]